MCGPLNLHNVDLLIKIMDTQMRNVGLKVFSLVAIFMILIQNSSFKVAGASGDEQLETMMEEDENDLWYPSRSYGIDELGAMEDDAWLMVQKKGNQFVVNDQPFYVNGFNTYWLMVFAADQSTRGKVTDLFKQASSVGLTVCRTWAFNDGQWRALQKSPSVYDEEVFKVL
jgi:mannan endo-1,4-beta-mannosidase